MDNDKRDELIDRFKEGSNIEGVAGVMGIFAYEVEDIIREYLLEIDGPPKS